MPTGEVGCLRKRGGRAWHQCTKQQWMTGAPPVPGKREDPSRSVQTFALLPGMCILPDRYGPGTPPVPQCLIYAKGTVKAEKVNRGMSSSGARRSPLTSPLLGAGEVLDPG